MLAAILSLTLLGALFGVLLGVASRFLRVDEPPVVDEVLAMLPGSNCGQCGFPGCSGAARAMVDGSALPTCCPAAGKAVTTMIVVKLGLSPDLSAAPDERKSAVVAEDLCIGCCRCSKLCPTDAILGAARQMHNVLRDACTGCGACLDICPTEALSMKAVPISVQHWVMPKPLAA